MRYRKENINITREMGNDESEIFNNFYKFRGLTEPTDIKVIVEDIDKSSI